MRRVALVLLLAGCDAVFGLHDVVDPNALPGPWKQIQAGDHVTCAATKTDELYCWGYNGDGQLGVGASDAEIDSPTLIALAWTAVATGRKHACGIHTDGSLACWGNDDDGQLASSSATSTSAPTAADLLPQKTFTAIAALADHTCAIAADKTLWCWGANASQQANPLLVDAIAPPAQILAEPAWLSVAPGLDHTCAIAADQSLWCWGANDRGQCGFASSDSIVPPTMIAGTFLAITSGAQYSCALDTDHHVECWGANRAGQLGRGTTSAFEPEPTAISTEIYSALSAGWTSACAISGEDVECWGDLTGISTPTSTPTAQFPTSKWVAVTIGRTHTCLLDSLGNLYCVGDNNAGELATAVHPTTTPTMIVDGVTSVSLGELSTCAVVGGMLQCWGDNAHGELATGDFTRRLVPTTAANTAGASEVAVGGEHGCMFDMNSLASCWGANAHGQLGVNSTEDLAIPAAISNVSYKITELALGAEHSCAVGFGAGAPIDTTWGRGTERELGTGATVDVLQPTSAALVFASVGATAAGINFTCWAMGGKVYCDGAHDQNQLSDSVLATFRSVTGGMLLDVTKLAAGHAHVCALAGMPGSEAIYCWGRNAEGQLGTAPSSSIGVPVETMAVGGFFSRVAAGAFHTCGVTTTGTVECWGRNDRGQLGIGTTVDSATPTAVSGLANVTAIAAGGATTCAIAGAGNTLYCWGDNGFGAVGVKTNWIAELTKIGLPE